MLTTLLRREPLLCALAALLLCGCEKDIDLDLNTAAAQLSIEANLADDGRPCQVDLSQTVNYTETNTFPVVSGAVITLRDDAGPQETLLETRPGHYEGRTVRGVPTHRYTLEVTVNGRTYAATSTLPRPVPFTGLRFEPFTFGAVSEIVAVPRYTDPAGETNYYYFRQYRNGRLLKTLYLQNDEVNDGIPNTQSLRAQGLTDDNDRLRSGDSVRVEMRNVDQAGYKYVLSLNQLLASTPLFTTTPANPVSNFSGGALGYFSAYARQQQASVVP